MTIKYYILTLIEIRYPTSDYVLYIKSMQNQNFNFALVAICAGLGRQSIMLTEKFRLQGTLLCQTL